MAWVKINRTHWHWGEAHPSAVVSKFNGWWYGKVSIDKEVYQTPKGYATRDKAELETEKLIKEHYKPQ